MFRYLPPAGNTIGLDDIAVAFRGMFDPGSAEIFTRKLQARLRVKHCYLTSSGTAALYLALVSLSRLAGKREVIFPAYTCPSILAAVVRAGLKPVLCDLAHEKSTMDLSELAGKITNDTLAVISVYLFGIRENAGKISELTSSRNIFHIEDAAQSFSIETMYPQGFPQSRPTPETAGTVGILSFGKGKPLTLLQGGAITTGSGMIAEALGETTAALEAQGSADTAALILKTVLYAAFFHPRLYWIAQRMPFLKLGQTIFNLNFEARRVNMFTCALGNILIDRLPQISTIRRQKEALFSRQLSHAHLLSLTDTQDSGPLLRFPLLMGNRSQRELALSRLKEYGLGATSMYEAPLHFFRDTKRYFNINDSFSNAQSFSERILTLPLHTFVTENDVHAIADIIGSCVNKNH
jgi:dTDP-4-amino-4,6-dideoxygalactose transaminase